MGNIYSDGSVRKAGIAYDAARVVPVLSLSPELMVESGNGSSTNPYNNITKKGMTNIFLLVYRLCLYIIGM